jgi:hypothetical protein
MLEAIVLPDDPPPPRPASAARLRAMARQLARARADDDPVRLLGLESAATRLMRHDRDRLRGLRTGAG